MKPRWLIEHFDDRNSTQLLIEEVEHQGYDLKTIKYIPFQSGSINVYNNNDCVITQTSINLAQQILKEKSGWIPGPWLTEKNYECSSYYARLGKYLFNDPYVIMSRDEIPRHLDWLQSILSKSQHLFIRPNSAMKPFTAKVFSLEPRLFESDWSWVKEFTFPETLIAISSPKAILAEWRFIVAGKTVITGSQYECDGKFNVSPIFPEEARALAQEVAEIYQPDPMFVIDICQGADSKYYLLELGAFSVAGLYACDMTKIVEAAVEAAEKQWIDFYSQPYSVTGH